jgi:hypothetical protein
MKTAVDYYSLTRLADLADNLTHEQSWMLFLLARSYLRHGFIPGTDDREMAIIAKVTLKKWLNARKKLALKFEQPGWRMPELDAAIARREKISVTKSLAGQKGNLVKIMYGSPGRKR